jgi:alpha,alpha-trehalase
MSPRPFCWLLSLASLAGCYVLVADDPRIRATVRANAAFVHDLGLLSEEVDGATGELLGNFPQAFSHVGLVNAAWAIAQAEAVGAAPATEPLR